MLIDQQTVRNCLAKHNIVVNGVLHIGAHDCEEAGFYSSMGVPPANVVWVDAMEDKVAQAKTRGIPNVFQAVVTDKDDDTVTFHVTNNVQSSSVLEFGSHAKHHPYVHFVRDVQLKTVTVDTLLSRNGLDASNYNFWNFDIQGAEMLALRGGQNALKFAKALYLEVNSEEVYKGCATIDQLDIFLGDLGFKRDITHMTQWGWGDAVYVR